MREIEEEEGEVGVDPVPRHPRPMVENVWWLEHILSQRGVWRRYNYCAKSRET